MFVRSRAGRCLRRKRLVRGKTDRSNGRAGLRARPSRFPVGHPSVPLNPSFELSIERACPSRALFSRLTAEESGFTIIEVLVSALVMVVIAVGVFKSLDTASARSGYQKDKGVAAGLAQQDQERLRAFTVQDLNNYVETRCLQKRTSGFVKDPECDDDPTLGPTYKVISRTDWVSDQSGTRSCGTGARADYIRISSTVTWANPSGTAESGREPRLGRQPGGPARGLLRRRRQPLDRDPGSQRDRPCRTSRSP